MDEKGVKQFYDLLFGQNRTSEDVPLGSGKLMWTFFTMVSRHFIDNK